MFKTHIQKTLYLYLSIHIFSALYEIGKKFLVSSLLFIHERHFLHSNTFIFLLSICENFFL